jgi:Rod binding domain-containing protein
MTGGLPPVDAALLPAEVRKAGPQAEKLYETALSFESVLSQQLAQALTSTLQTQDDSDDSSDDSSSSGDASTTLLTQMLPDSLSQSLTAAGGLGMAQQLYGALQGDGAVEQDPATAASTTDGASS